jgi:uncharacterized protein (TIGR03435 family)
MTGGPGWIDTDHFDIEAVTGGAGPATSAQQTWVMVQTLLEDRFQLKIHHESREIPVYNLVIAKGGSKLSVSEDQTPPNLDAVGAPGAFFDPRKPLPRGILSSTGVDVQTVAGNAVPVSRLWTVLRTFVQRPIIDRTGLTGLFDFKFSFTPECGVIFACGPVDSTPSGPSLFDALEQQLGLRLESTKDPVEVLVIDSVQRPTEN